MWFSVVDDRRMLLLSMVYRLVCSLLGLIAVLVRRDLSNDAELLVVRHENAVLRRLRWDTRTRDYLARRLTDGKPTA
ncbi:MAG: hypothetical protein LC749_09165 [Actinobacteria bacterium]|nr:hypothetical protein [Actinomycetota bacterium]